MPKITIYVPDDLKADMDAAEKQEPNWSAIAQDAFRAECRLLSNRRKGAGKMNEVIERLRKSKENEESDGRVAGHAVGRQWAMSRAEYGELERVAKWHEAERSGEVGSYAWDLFCHIEGTPGASRPRDAAEFWENFTDEGNPADAFIEGFAQGAAEVFDEVADKL